MGRSLIVLTGAGCWTSKNGYRHPAGYWAEEFVSPYDGFTDAGYEVTMATPGVVIPVVDTMSLQPRYAGGEENMLKETVVIEPVEQLRHPIAINDVRLEDYDAVYYPGGHGPMEDLAFDADSAVLLRKAFASGKPLAIVCHARAAILATRDEHGKTPFADLNVTGFCNEEEGGVGFTEDARWPLEDELKKLPTKYTRGPARESYSMSDGNLHTGQYPVSSGPLAREVVKVLS
ncbi:type 1 glutamine amidotransferase domain-containing protein [Streptomyces sp. NPDC048295]|uniref:type 1 glutamine amidotransferase domain-containing protein n=1 Tax=Streptomyces sp. NPDC048295 TaxID=3154617 RepID=UPI0034200C55